MQKNAVHFAVVQDEHGGVDGVVTVEDLVEEIVGEIADEHDTPEDELDAVTKSPGEMTVDGGIKIDDINEILPKPLPAGEYETVAGFIMHILGRLPKQGEEIPYDGVRFKIAQMEQTRINSVTIYFGKKINQLAKEAPKVSVGHGLTETEDHEPLPKIA